MIDNSKILLFSVAVGIALLTKNAYIPFVVFTGLFMIDRRFFVSSILITPIVETVLIVAEGFTLTKLQAIFFIFIFSVELLRRNRFSIDKRSRYLVMYFFVALFGLVNAFLFGEFWVLISWNYNQVIRESFISVFPKIIFTLVMYIYIKDKGKSFLIENLKLATKVIPLSLIIVSIYFITIGSTSTDWWNVVTRLTFQGTDPNEFSAIFLTLGVFSIYSVFFSKSRVWTLIGVLSSLMVAYSVFLTLSRGGILTLMFCIVLVLVFFSKRNMRRSLTIVLIGLILLGILVMGGFLDLNPVYERFFGKHVRGDVSSLTAGRTAWIESALNSIAERPFLGFGGSRYASRWVNYQNTGRNAAMHSIYLEILIQYGIIGLLVFLAIFIRVFKDMLAFFEQRSLKNQEDSILLIPYLSLSLMLFAGLALSWEWRELLWYLIALCMATAVHLDGDRDSRQEFTSC